MEDDTRVTKFGGFIIRVRIYKIPEMLNVLRGDIRLVEPYPEQPILVKELAKKIPFHTIKHFIKSVASLNRLRSHSYRGAEENPLRTLKQYLY